MNTCDICGYKVVSHARFELHKASHEVQYAPEVPAVEPTVESIVSPVVEFAAPVVEAPAIPEEITLRFTKSVEITINGKQYFGKEIVVKNMSIAADIVRIAREGYGPTILA